MSTTLFGGTARAAIHERIDRLSPKSGRRWGAMSARQMVCHVSDHLRVAIGDLEAHRGPIRLRFGGREIRTDPGLLRFAFFRRILVHRLPWPRARVGAPPEMLTSSPTDWSGDIAALHALVDRIGEKDPADRWAPHPFFGRISGREWGLICWKHLDYHLGQFGV